MQTIELLKEEEAALQKQLSAIQGAIAALNGHGRTRATSANTSNGKRTLSAAVRLTSGLQRGKFRP